MTEPRTVETIDLTPTPDGYEGMARLFVDGLLAKVALDDRDSAVALLGTIVKIAAYLGQLPDGAARVARVVARIEGAKR